MHPPYLHDEGLASDIHAQTVQCEEVPNADKLRAALILSLRKLGGVGLPCIPKKRFHRNFSLVVRMHVCRAIQGKKKRKG